MALRGCAEHQICLQFDDSFKPKLAAQPVKEEKHVKTKDTKKDTPEWLQKRQMSSATYQIRKQVRLCCDSKHRASRRHIDWDFLPSSPIILARLFAFPFANSTPNSDADDFGYCYNLDGMAVC